MILRLFCVVLGLLWLVGGNWLGALAAASSVEPPAGFRLIEHTTGVQLFRKDYKNGSPDFVQVVDLSQGARVKLLHGPIKEPRTERGVFGGPDPRILSRSMQQYWDAAKERYVATFCITNGQFFYMLESPTRLPFSLKVDGAIVSDGYAKTEHAGQKLMLEIWDGQVDIQPLSEAALYQSSAPDIVAGLTEDARKSPTKYVARTFVGVADQDQDRQFETILIFNSSTARQKDAADVLRSFGAEKVMMLDGGGSTQLMCQGKSIIASERLIPQALAVLAGNPLYRDDKKVQMVTAGEGQPEKADTPDPTIQPEMAVEPEVEATLTVPQALLAAAVPGEQAAIVMSAPQVALFRPTDLLWIPGVIGPVAVILFLVLLRWRSTY